MKVIAKINGLELHLVAADSAEFANINREILGYPTIYNAENPHDIWPTPISECELTITE